MDVDFSDNSFYKYSLDAFEKTLKIIIENPDILDKFQEIGFLIKKESDKSLKFCITPLDGNYFFNKIEFQKSNYTFDIIYNSENEIIVNGEINGYTEDQIKLECINNCLRISGFNNYENFKTELEISNLTNVNITKKIKNGILEIIIKKSNRLLMY